MENRADDVKHLRAELAELVKRRTEIGENLRNLERQIFAFEGSYLEDTISYGNVVRGWERYMNPNRVLSKSETKLQGKRKFKESDRLFSRSSVTGLCSVTGESINGTADELGSSVENNVPSSPEHQERSIVTQKSHNDHGKFIRPSSVAFKPTDRAAPRPSTSSAHKSTSATQRVKKTSSSPSSSSVSASKKSRTK